MRGPRDLSTHGRMETPGFAADEARAQVTPRANRKGARVVRPLDVPTILAILVVTRMNEIFCVSVRNGKMLLIRGTCPNTLFHDLQDVMRRADVQRATLRAVKTDGHARLLASGVDDGIAQRCRNTFGTHPLHQLRSASSPQRRNLGQVLGIGWLAWLFATLN